jgi:hypothetical protein
MKKQNNSFTQWLSLLAAFSLLMTFAGVAWAAEAGTSKDKWPKQFQHPKGTVVMYQPQLEDMKDDKLTAYAAVSFQKKDWKQPVFGAVWLTAQVVTDRDERMATIDQVKVTDIKFPDAKPEQLEAGKQFLNTEMQDWSFPIALDRLVAALEAVEKKRTIDEDLKNDPPKIIFRDHPAVLVLLDGEPKLLPIPESKLMRVANTPFAMLYDTQAKTYYLKGGDTWLSASDLKGPWKDMESLPEDLQKLQAQLEEKKEEIAKKTGKGKPPKEVEKKAGKLPEIIVATVPTELLVTDGEPQYTPIKDTNLLYVANTEDNIFMNTAGQEYYTLISGRWFTSKSLKDGSWKYVAPDKLPGDFAQIPSESTKGFVLVSVAGTTQAKEAILDNSIPQTAAIDRKEATTEVHYAGKPTFEKISGTNLQYAVNTGTAVFKAGDKYYALDQGVWYEADSPEGPWKVSVNPPEEVDKVPASNPHYNAKYVKVYNSTDDTAYVGYTPGYTGSYVDNGTVVYGTGYDYPSYSTADAYIPYQSTYGYAATYDPYESTWGYQPSYYTPWNWLGPGLVGFGAGYAVGAATSNWWRGGYYGGGGWWGSGGYYYNNVNINHNYINNRPYRPGNRWPGYQPGRPPGWRPGEGWKPGDRPGRPGKPGRPSQLPSNIYNRPRPGRPATRPVAGVRPERPATPPAAGVKPVRPGAQPRPATRPQARPAKGPNNVFADRNGNVYRRDNKGNWQQRQGNQWAKAQAARPASRPSRPAGVSRPTPRPVQPAARPSFNASNLNRNFQARQRGQVRTQNFQRVQRSPAFRPSGGGGGRPAGGFSRPSGGGGGFRGGGGRGGGRRR